MPRKGKDPSEEQPKFLVLFSGYHSPKLELSITTDQLAHSRMISVEIASLEEWEPENETNNFVRSYL